MENTTKSPLFYFRIWTGGVVTNGNGRLHRWLTIIIFGFKFSKVIWSWKVGNGDDGIRSRLSSN